MRIIVSGPISEQLMSGVEAFAADTEATVAHVDEDARTTIVTVTGDLESGLAHLLGALSKVMRTFGISKADDDGLN